MRFEEKVEEGGERWSKPHVSTLSLHSLFELRTCLQTGVVLLDLDGYSLPQIVGEGQKSLHPPELPAFCSLTTRNTNRLGFHAMNLHKLDNNTKVTGGKIQ